MRVGSNKLIVIKILFAIILILMLPLYSCQNNTIIENEETPKGAPIQEINSDEFVVNFISDKFEYHQIRAGVIDLSESAIASDDWGIHESKVYLTEIQMEDGSVISFFEPEDEVVEMYNSIGISNIIAAVITSQDGSYEVIKPEHENFKTYKIMLLQEKRKIQHAKLTDLDVLLSNSILLGDYEVVLLNEDSTTTLMRSTKLYENDHFILMLTTYKSGESYFRVDADFDMVFDHYYESESKVLDINSFITADPIEQFLYESIMDMVHNDKRQSEVEYQGSKYVITFN
jgi:hypothetical protein